MQRNRPPFRADHVGSLLRSPALKEARALAARGEITAEELREIEDRDIEALIRKQEAVGLKSVTDGENRRRSWQTDFRPTASCLRMTFSISRSSIALSSAAPISPRSRLARASFSAGGRSRLPT